MSGAVRRRGALPKALLVGEARALLEPLIQAARPWALVGQGPAMFGGCP